MFQILKFFKFFKTKLGIITICAIATFAFAIANKLSQPKKNTKPKNPKTHLSISEKYKEPPVTTINRNIHLIKTKDPTPPQVITETILQDINESLEKSENSSKNGKPFPIILNIYNKILDQPKEVASEFLLSKENIRETVPARFAPFGRMLKCELINTVDSSNLETPIIGLVMEPVYWNGELIIPAGSEVHGIATTDKLRERIASGEKWIIILPAFENRLNGMSLKVNGVVLDREDLDGEGKNYGIEDGSFGLKGYRIKSNNLEEIKLFASTFLGALASGLQTQVPSGSLFGGEVPDNTLRDASLGGLTSVMNRIAEKIEKEIDANGFYTRVPAGKQFYLYVQQNINPDDWVISENLQPKETSIDHAEAWIDKIKIIKETLN